MDRQKKKGSSISLKLFRLLVLSAAVAFLSFYAIEWAGDYALGVYLDGSDYEKKQNDRLLEELTRYINEQELTKKDVHKLQSWVDKKGILTMEVYDGNSLIFNSAYPEETEVLKVYKTSAYEETGPNYPIQFKDGTAQVFLYGFYEYQFYNYIFILALLVAFLIFCIMVLAGIRNTMRYIQKLSEEISILEGGNLDYEVTVKGRDELSVLAKSLDDMRKSFRSQIEQENELMQRHKQTVTQMSHDLRTPLTGLMLYSEVLRRHQYKDEAGMLSYLDKMDKKVCEIKQMSDHIFEYSLGSTEQRAVLAEPLAWKEVCYDALSELTLVLTECGFTVKTGFEWQEAHVRVDEEYLSRIFNNLISNLRKYANSEGVITLKTISLKNQVGFSIENTKKRDDGENKGSKIGLLNVKSMMEQMEGTLEAVETEKTYEVRLLFPVVSSEKGQD